LFETRIDSATILMQDVFYPQKRHLMKKQGMMGFYGSF